MITKRAKQTESKFCLESDGSLKNFFFIFNRICDDELYVWDRYKRVKRKMSNTEWRLYVNLIRLANNSETCFASYANLSERIGVSRRQTITSMNVLTDSGYVVKKEIGGIEVTDECLQAKANTYMVTQSPVVINEKDFQNLG